MTQTFTKSLLLLAFLGLSISGFAQFSGGNGTSGNPYQITTAAQLAQLATFVNSGDIIYNAAHYKLMNNLDLSEYSSGEGWIPIGNHYPNKPFSGVFDGNGKVITGLYIENTIGNCSGLFGYVPNGIIKNLGMENVSINALFYVGGIVGTIAGEDAMISHCYVTGTINGNYNAETRIGGIAGTADGLVTITHCYSTAAVSGAGKLVGGIAGRVTNDCIISHCYATGIISGTRYVGGIAGYCVSSSVTSNCVALNPNITTATIDFGRIGWLYNLGSLSNNYAFDGMLNPDGTTQWNNIGGAAEDGADLSIPEIHADGTLKGLFTSADGWTTQNGKLPGLFGNTVTMPPHLSLVPTAPVITTTSLPDGAVGTAYSEHLFATGSNPITWSVASGALPAGLSLSTGGIISGTPTAAGAFTFTIKAENSVGNDTQSLSITIEEANTPPVITTTTLPDAAIGVLYSYTLTATSVLPVTWSIVGGSSVAGIVLSANGVLSGTPTTAGTFPFTVKATNSAGEDTKELKITITGEVIPPTITTTTLPDGATGTAYNATLEASGTAAFAWTIAAGNLPNGLTLLNTGAITGTPTTEGTFTFTVKASNSAGEDTKELKITINSVGVGTLRATSLRVYPNPTTGELRVESGELKVNNVEIFDMMGRMQKAESRKVEGGVVMDVSHFANGIYFIKVGNQTVKVIKN